MSAARDQSARPGVVDFLVYAPLGMAITLVEDLPRLAELGRERASAPLAMARVVGTVAISECWRRVERLGYQAVAAGRRSRG